MYWTALTIDGTALGWWDGSSGGGNFRAVDNAAGLDYLPSVADDPGKQCVLMDGRFEDMLVQVREGGAGIEKEKKKKKRKFVCLFPQKRNPGCNIVPYSSTYMYVCSSC